MAKYHINPETGKAGVCSAKIACRFKLEENEHYESQAEAYKAYEIQQTNTIENSVSKKDSLNSNSNLSEKQKDFFKNTHCVDEKGQLIKAYHGASVDFDSFDNNTLGRGNDSWGNGFYFTTMKETAQGYANESNSETANVKEFYVNLKNPIIVDGKEHMSLPYELSLKEAISFVKNHPNIYLQPGEEDEYGNTNPLEDYDDTFWDKDNHSKTELEKKAERVAKEYFVDSHWSNMENFYGRDHGKAFTENAVDITGHDGVIVDFKEDGKFFIAWDNKAMKLTHNENPDNDDNF